MKNIKKIAVAIDFSENSRVAYKYSKALAQRFDMKIELIHVFALPVNPDGLHGFGFIPPVDEQINIVKQNLQQFADDENVKCTVHFGFAPDKLVELSQEKAFDLLIIGNSDERGLLSKLFGSVAIDVAKKAHCPVLLIPPNADFKDIKNIVYTISEKSTDEDGINVTKNWAEAFDAKIHFIHVDRPETNDQLPDVIPFMKDSDIDFAVKDLEFVTVRGGIDWYCEKKSIDIIVSMTQNNSFWDNIFHQSITSALSWNNQLPILVLHKDIIEAPMA